MVDSPIMAGCRVILLTNFVPPYRIPVFLELQKRLKQFRVLISTSMEAGRPWIAETGGIDVVTQHSVTFKARWKHPRGFDEQTFLHFPYDTLLQLIRYRPNVVISGEFGFRTLNAVLYRLLFRKSRLVIWATLSEDTERYRSRIHIFARTIMTRFADAIMTNGRSGIRYLEKFPIARRRLFIVPQTTDIQAFASVSERRDRAGAYRMLYSGRLIARKQLVTFVAALKTWCIEHPEREAELWLVGDGPEREKLENFPLVPNLTLKFLGNVNYGDLPGIYGQCGALVLPTLADEWALVVNEGLAAGMPVLGSLYSQAVQDLVVDGDNGWVFRVNHPGELREALAKFLATDEPDLERMRARARKSIAGLTPEAVVDRMISIMEFASEGT